MKLPPLAWWVYRVFITGFATAWIWMTVRPTAGVLIFCAIFAVNASAYFDGVSVGEGKK